MLPNFIEPIKDFSNRFRNIIVGVLLVAAAVFFILNKTVVADESVKVLAKVIRPITGLDKLANRIGGDKEFTPPPVPVVKLPELKGEKLDLSNFSATNVAVKDVKTGMILLSKNEYEKHSLASVTKLMSALVILEKNIDWSATTTVVSDNIEDTHMYSGDTYTMEELWNSSLIASSNKAILTLADAVGWPREAFVERMNAKATEIGMTMSVFAEPTGLSEDNQASAADTIILLNEALKNEKIAKTLLVKEYNLYSKERKQKHHMWNTNWILLGWIPNKLTEFLGGKTGYTVAAGYNFVMRVGNGSGNLIDVVVFGTKTNEERFTEASRIAEWTFNNYTWPL